MNKVIYHGSKQIIKSPYYGGGKKNNDYGLGFYCTFEKDLAEEWSVSLKESGYCNKYEIDTSKLTILELDKYTSLVWVTILIQNRIFSINNPMSAIFKQYLIDNFSINYNDYDVIYGYRADDSYFDFAKSFLNNTISLSYLEDALKFGNLGYQFVLKSRKAFENITFIEAEKINPEKYYLRKVLREKFARTLYVEGKLAEFNKNDIYIKDIIEKGLTINDF